MVKGLDTVTGARGTVQYSRAGYSSEGGGEGSRVLP